MMQCKSMQDRIGMKRAVNLLRRVPLYRRDIFDNALKRHGYDVSYNPLSNPSPDDILIIWNRYSSSAKQADAFEKVGATVLVVENSYLDMRDTKKAFAISLNHHLGGGCWPLPKHSRFELLDITLKPWRTRGKTVLLLPQRGIGHPSVAMPKNWASKTELRLHKKANRPIHVRKHPELLPEHRRVPLEHDLSKAWCAVTWASSAAIKAIVAGVPVFFEFPEWIAGSCSIFGTDQINHEDPVQLMGDREEMLSNLAWGQWTTEEVYEGTWLEYYLERR